jgi:hypothetical protein
MYVPLAVEFRTATVSGIQWKVICGATPLQSSRMACARIAVISGFQKFPTEMET